MFSFVRRLELKCWVQSPLKLNIFPLSPNKLPLSNLESEFSFDPDCEMCELGERSGFNEKYKCNQVHYLEFGEKISRSD
jgi:hypothetical protein